jgi:hypothetical protein
MPEMKNVDDTVISGICVVDRATQIKLGAQLATQCQAICMHAMCVECRVAISQRTCMPVAPLEDMVAQKRRNAAFARQHVA